MSSSLGDMSGSLEDVSVSLGDMSGSLEDLVEV
jgi:hypothetical protein